VHQYYNRDPYWAGVRRVEESEPGDL
jgi:hypothetical protein